jgi:branched-chain amino acid transport system substrate-binding protein
MRPHPPRSVCPNLIRSATKSRYLVSSALCGMLLALAACGGAEPPLVLAAAGEWTGPDERAMRQGIELAVKVLNEEGGIDGRMVRVEFHDDSNSVTAATRVADSLVANSAVVGVIGHARSDPTLVAMKVYDGHLPVITARFHSPDLTGLSRWLFQSVPTDSAYSAAVVRFAGERGLGRTAMLFNNTARGRATAEHFQKQYRGQVVALDPAFFPAPLPGDLKVFVEYHRQQAPDLVFAPIGEPREYIDEAQRQGLRAAVVGWDVWSSQTHDPSLPGDFYHVVPFDLAGARAETRAFVERFRREHGGEMPSPFAALGYDAVRLFAAAAKEAGADRASIRDALAGLSADHPYAGVTGPLSFAADGTVAGPEPAIVPLRASTASAASSGSTASTASNGSSASTGSSVSPGSTASTASAASATPAATTGGGR